MPMIMRGKFTSGNTATGIVNARYAPITARAIIKKMRGFESRENQYSGVGAGVGCTSSIGVIFVAMLTARFHPRPCLYPLRHLLSLGRQAPQPLLWSCLADRRRQWSLPALRV